MFRGATRLLDQLDDPLAAFAAVDGAAEIDGVAQDRNVLGSEQIGEDVRQFMPHLPKRTVTVRLEEGDYATLMRFEGAQRGGAFLWVVAEIIDHRHPVRRGSDHVEATRQP